MFVRCVAVITGASSGIGAAIARRFAKGRLAVALLARRRERLEALQRELGEKAFLYECDVCDAAQVRAVVASIEQDVGAINLLVNNAGLAMGLAPAYEASQEDWDAMIRTNIQGLLHCTRAVLPGMIERNQGQIINIGSIAGVYPYTGSNVYGATKAFVRQFSLNLRADLLGKKIRVNCIEPGIVSGTEFSRVRFGGDERRADAVYEGVQALEPADIAEIAHFCYSVPPHVNLNIVECMPVSQAFDRLGICRQNLKN